MDVDIAKQRKFAEAIRLVTTEMAGRRSKVGEWMQAAQAARSRARRFTQPYQRRLYRTAISDARTYARRALQCDEETHPAVVEAALSQFIAELAVLRERSHTGADSGSALRAMHSLPSSGGGKPGGVAAAGVAKGTATSTLLPGGTAALAGTQVHNTGQSVDTITDRLMVRFGMAQTKTFVHMDEVCDRCRVNKEVLSDIGKMWCPSCGTLSDNTDMGVQSVESSRRRNRDSRYSLVKKMLKDLRHAQAQEPTAVSEAIVRVVARILLARGWRDPASIPFSETDHVVREHLRADAIEAEVAKLGKAASEVHLSLEDDDDDEGDDEDDDDEGEEAATEVRAAARAKATKARRTMRNIFRHIPQIHCRVTSQKPLRFTATEHRMLYLIFQVIADNYEHFKGARTNFMSYKHVIFRMCQILCLERALPFFSSLKEATKPQHDKILVQIFHKVGLPDLISRTPETDAAAKAYYASIGCKPPSVLATPPDAKAS